MTGRRFDGWDFEHLGTIEPDRDGAGRHCALLPQGRFERAATARLHAYGQGPFCRSRIARKRHEAGRYVRIRWPIPTRRRGASSPSPHSAAWDDRSSATWQEHSMASCAALLANM